MATKTKTFVLLDYCGGAKRIYAGNDASRVKKAVDGYRSAGWPLGGRNGIHRIKARTFAEAADNLGRKLYPET